MSKRLIEFGEGMTMSLDFPMYKKEIFDNTTIYIRFIDRDEYEMIEMATDIDDDSDMTYTLSKRKIMEDITKNWNIEYFNKASLVIKQSEYKAISIIYDALKKFDKIKRT
jgi:hypothetical protein